MSEKLGLLVYGLLYGTIIALPLLMLIRMIDNDMPVERIAPTACWWVVMLVMSGLIGRLALGRPRPSYASYMVTRRFLGW